MKVTIFGVGYVGLVQAAVLSDVGHDVYCIDIDEEKVKQLNNGHIPIYEPGLTPLVETNLEAGRLTFTTDAAAGVRHADIIFIAVGTPPDEDGSADLKYVLAVAETIAQHMDDKKIIVNKSTVPVGTADKVSECIGSVLNDRGEKIAYSVVSNPEFLKEGAAVGDCSKPDRIILGTKDAEAELLLRELYAPFNRNHDRVLVMDERSAELTKYAANCMLATKISFINEIANLAERLGADVEQVRQGIGSDPRIGYSFIYPGCGYGGSCFPKDVSALINIAEQEDYDSKLLKAVEVVNAQQKQTLFSKLNNYFNGSVAGKTVAVWGLAFKPETDDMRDASSRVLIDSLLAAGSNVRAYDPVAMEEATRIYGIRDDFELVGTKEQALKSADALVICTEWKAFRAPDFEQIKEMLTAPVIIDGRNLYDPITLKRYGIDYYGVGRGDSIKSVGIQ